MKSAWDFVVEQMDAGAIPTKAFVRCVNGEVVHFIHNGIGAVLKREAYKGVATALVLRTTEGKTLAGVKAITKFFKESKNA
jgi:hypothetical protein